MFRTSALDLWQLESSQPPIITGSQQLDAAIGGGIPMNVITEFCGPPGSGKTQLCLQLCVNVQIPLDMGGLAGSAVYIDTNNGFSPHRLREIASACVDHLDRIRQSQKTSQSSATSSAAQTPTNEFSAERILDNVLCTYVSTHVELLAAVCHLKSIILAAATGDPLRNVRLIVIDSVSAVCHTQPDGSLTSIDRVRILYDMMSDLELLARRIGCAVVFTNELTTRLGDRNTESTVVPALGATHSHRLGQQLALGRVVADDETKQQPHFMAHVLKSLSCPKSKAVFKVTVDGVRDI